MLLAFGIALVGTKIYLLWKSTPWEVPTNAGARSLPPNDTAAPRTGVSPLVSTDTIVSKNLFDPQRGEGKTAEVELSSRAAQRIRGMVLLGTAIVGNDRVAIVRDQGVAVPGQRAVDQSQNVMRLKVGDNIEGFRVAEIDEKRVVFSQGASTIEVALDYFRKDPVQPQRPAPTPAPRSVAPGQPASPTPPRLIPRRPVQPDDGGAQPQVTPVPSPGAAPAPPRVIPNLPRRGTPVPPQPPSGEEKAG